MMCCPNCHRRVPFQKSLFRGTHCEGCNSTLLVSERYSRALWLLSFLAAEALVWIANIRMLFYPRLGVPFGFLASLWLGFPVAFFILSVMVRTIPRLVPPTLVVRHWGTVTTLDLDSDDSILTNSSRGK